MGQAYKIDRVNLITYNGQKRKILRSMRCRYLAKESGHPMQWAIADL